MEKQIIMLVQAAPKTQPGGVQGAFVRFKYQSVFGPLFMSQLPNANPPKLMSRNKIKYLVDEHGELIDYYYSITSPTSSKIKKHLQ